MERSTSWWWGADPPGSRSATSSAAWGSTTSSWSAAGSARRGAIAGTASASSPRTGPCGSRAAPTPATTPTASCPATRSSPTSSDTPRLPGRPSGTASPSATIDRVPGGFVARTSAGDLRATRVVLCTGAFQRAHRPAGADTLPAGLPAIDLGGLPQSGGPAAGPGPGHRQRAVGLPAGGGAARGRPERRPLVREGTVGAASAGWPRRRLVAGGVGLPRPAGIGPAVPCCPPRREPVGDRSRRRP